MLMSIFSLYKQQTKIDLKNLRFSQLLIFQCLYNLTFLAQLNTILILIILHAVSKISTYGLLHILTCSLHYLFIISLGMLQDDKKIKIVVKS